MAEDIAATGSSDTKPSIKKTGGYQGNNFDPNYHKSRNNNNNNNNNRRSQKEAEAEKTTKFEGRCEAIAGHTYDCTNQRVAADTFTRTTKEISEDIGRTYK